MTISTIVALLTIGLIVVAVAHARKTLRNPVSCCSYCDEPGTEDNPLVPHQLGDALHEGCIEAWKGMGR